MHRNQRRFRVVFIAYGVIVMMACFVPYLYAIAADGGTERPSTAESQEQRFSHELLGGEYWEIAKTIAQSHRYGDPFSESPVATAWMPPLWPCVLAVLHTITGGNVVLVVLGNWLLFALLWSLTLREVANHCTSPALHLPALVVATIAMLAYGRELFLQTHDSLLVAFVLTFVACRCPKLDIRSFVNSPYGWGAWGGLASLVSPAVTGSWIVLTAWAYVRGMPRRPICIAVLVVTAICSPWIVRNALVFHRFIPIKSNAWFEFYQTLCLDQNGMLSEGFAQHPFLERNQAIRHRQMGEMAFVDLHRDLAIRCFLDHPLRWLSQVVNRSIAVLISGRAMELDGWPDAVVLIETLARWIMSAAWLGCILRIRHVEDRIQAIVLASIAYVLPYLLVSYYDRYAAPLIGLQMLMALECVRRGCRPGDPAGRVVDPGVIQ
jgi:hypothetical protein